MADAHYLAIIWHFHQPSYQIKNKGILPWVRLHAAKNYLPMALILDDFPDIRCTFNFTPTLIEQLLNPTSDFYFDLSSKPVNELTQQEREFLVNKFFMANFETMIKPSPRYLELYEKRMQGRYFTDLDILDLTVHFNLAWTSQKIIDRDPLLKKLKSTGSNFTSEERSHILNVQKNCMNEVVEKFKNLYQSGKVELITSPFYHPIIPLLIQNELREDANKQIIQGIDCFTSAFGKKPKGMWPSELAVSMEGARLIKENGVEWLIADEDVIYNLPKNLPYNLGGIDMVFRSKLLSNLISFDYKNSKPKEAAVDLMQQIAGVSNSAGNNSLTVIALDGENPWEHYKDHGITFLTEFFRLLQSDSVQSITISEYLKINKERETLHSFSPGSWINNNLDVWSAHEEDKKGWKLLKKVRSEQGFSKDIMEAEGSDWFWWFGPEFQTSLNVEFDMLFRKHLMACYSNPPLELFYPIKNLNYEQVYKKPWALLQIELDGLITDYFEWLPAGVYKFINEHDNECQFSQMLFGTDESNFFLRIDFTRQVDPSSLKLQFIQPEPRELPIIQCKHVLDQVLEICYPLEELKITEGDEIEFFIQYGLG